ncbi:hypothetical protein EBR04_08285 [bacterium]|nr:hypothetical protein [bacterium]
MGTMNVMLRAGLFLSVLLSGTALAAESWYVAVDGDDAASGSLQQPFATVRRAQQAASPGDTVFIRGGIYRLAAPDPAATASGLFARLIVLDKSGRPGSPITYRGYADERPVFDCRDARPANQRVTAFFVSGSWLRLIGLEVVGVQGTSTESEAGLADINRLVDRIVTQSIPAVFVETSVSDRNVTALREGARARGHVVSLGGQLYSDALGGPGSGAETLEAMLMANVETIHRGLSGTAVGDRQ